MPAACRWSGMLRIGVLIEFQDAQLHRHDRCRRRRSAGQDVGAGSK